MADLPHILIVDEILAVGDAHFAHKSLAKMTEFKKGYPVGNLDLGVDRLEDHAALRRRREADPHWRPGEDDRDRLHMGRRA